jgi:dTDP-4-dehydrorhamnose 3,5-epimerase
MPITATLYISLGFAHGLQTLEADTEVVYTMSDFYRPDIADRVRLDDPAFGIQWLCG